MAKYKGNGKKRTYIAVHRLETTDEDFGTRVTVAPGKPITLDPEDPTTVYLLRNRAIREQETFGSEAAVPPVAEGSTDPQGDGDDAGKDGEGSGDGFDDPGTGSTSDDGFGDAGTTDAGSADAGTAVVDAGKQADTGKVDAGKPLTPAQKKAAEKAAKAAAATTKK